MPKAGKKNHTEKLANDGEANDERSYLNEIAIRLTLDLQLPSNENRQKLFETFSKKLAISVPLIMKKKDLQKLKEDAFIYFINYYANDLKEALKSGLESKRDETEGKMNDLARLLLKSSLEIQDHHMIKYMFEYDPFTKILKGMDGKYNLEREIKFILDMEKGDSNILWFLSKYDSSFLQTAWYADLYGQTMSKSVNKPGFIVAFAGFIESIAEKFFNPKEGNLREFIEKHPPVKPILEPIELPLNPLFKLKELPPEFTPELVKHSSISLPRLIELYWFYSLFFIENATTPSLHISIRPKLFDFFKKTTIDPQDDSKKPDSGPLSLKAS